jgi:hypothetical protein
MPFAIVINLKLPAYDIASHLVHHPHFVAYNVNDGQVFDKSVLTHLRHYLVDGVVVKVSVLFHVLPDGVVVQTG